MAGYLYLVATPIGNLSDITLRAINTLQTVDFIAAEDTRVTGKLLHHIDVKKEMISYHLHNQVGRGEEIVLRLLGGESCALLTDAGTPAISDPGEALVALCIERKVRVIPIPGACAAVTALCASGLPTERFCFEGFLSTQNKTRRKQLSAILEETRTMIFYEAPHKLLATLKDLEENLGDRRIAVCREMTKLYEELNYMTLSEAQEHFLETKPRGEFVLVVEGAKEKEKEPFDSQTAVQEVLALTQNGMRLKEAVKQVAENTGAPKNALYQAVLQEKNAKDE